MRIRTLETLILFGALTLIESAQNPIHAGARDLYTECLGACENKKNECFNKCNEKYPSQQETNLFLACKNGCGIYNTECYLTCEKLRGH
jgi:hypothetical protein